VRQSSQELAEDIEEGLSDLSGRILNLTSILKEQGRLRAVTAQQTIISELLEIPALGRTLIRQHYYTEVFELFEFVNKLRLQIGGEFTERLSQEISRLKEDAKADMIKQLTENLEELKAKSIIRNLQNLYTPSEVCKIFLFCRRKHIQDKTSRRKEGLEYLVDYISYLSKMLPNHTREFKSLFESEFENSLELNIVDIVLDFLDVLEKNIQSIESLKDLRKVLEEVWSLNESTLLNLGLNLFSNIKIALIERAVVILEELFDKTYAHFENMLRLYQWESSGSKENPLMEFGSIAVLYNNILAINNEMRVLRLPELAPAYYTSINSLLCKCVEFALSKGGHLINSDSLTRQQTIYKNLFLRYMNVIFNQCLKVSFYPSVKKVVFATFSEEYSEIMVLFT
jgi:hypothetical protein